MRAVGNIFICFHNPFFYGILGLNFLDKTYKLYIKPIVWLKKYINLDII